MWRAKLLYLQIISASAGTVQMTIFLGIYRTGFFPGGTGGPPSSENFVNPPIQHLSPFLDQGLFPPAEVVRPRKFEKLKYIFGFLSSKVPLKAVFHA